jgi:hypothetical protein
MKWGEVCILSAQGWYFIVFTEKKMAKSVEQSVDSLPIYTSS